MVSFRQIVIGSVLFSAFAHAKEPIVLDLGRIQIEGEVRRPFIKVLDTSESIKKVVKNMKINELVRFESEMLVPHPLPPKKENRNDKSP